MAKTKETLVVGDLHGQIESAQFLVKYADEREMDIIFLGDLTDSFSRSIKDQLETLRLVLRYMDKGHHCIWGNHDLSYICPTKHRCAGWSYKKAEKYAELYKEIEFHENFVPFYYFEDYKILITHAGFTYKLVPEQFKDSPIEYLKKESEKKDFLENSPLLKAGHISGGHQPYGGITWLRPQKYHSLPHIRQIAGHTPQRWGIKKPTDDLWIIDTIEYGNKSVVKITTDGIIEEITMDEYWR